MRMGKIEKLKKSFYKMSQDLNEYTQHHLKSDPTIVLSKETLIKG